MRKKRKKKTEYEIVACSVCGQMFVTTQLVIAQGRRCCSRECSHEAQARAKEVGPDTLVHVDGGEGHEGFDLAPDVAERLIKLRSSVQFIEYKTKTMQHKDYVKWLTSLDR